MKLEVIEKIKGLKVEFDVAEDKINVKRIRIKTRLYRNKNFVILVFKPETSFIDIALNFSKFRMGFGLERFYIFQNEKRFILVSFNILPWVKYKQLLFLDIVDDIFKKECNILKEGYIDIDYTKNIDYLGDIDTEYKTYLGNLYYIYGEPEIDETSKMLKETFFNLIKVEENEKKKEESQS